MFEEGATIKQDFKQSVNWYRKSAQQGFPEAQFNLARLYVLAKGVKPDAVRCYVWSSFAATSGIESASQLRKIIETKMTSAQITEAQKLINLCGNNNYNRCD